MKEIWVLAKSEGITVVANHRLGIRLAAPTVVVKITRCGLPSLTGQPVARTGQSIGRQYLAQSLSIAGLEFLQPDEHAQFWSGGISSTADTVQLENPGAETSVRRKVESSRSGSGPAMNGRSRWKGPCFALVKSWISWKSRYVQRGARHFLTS